MKLLYHGSRDVMSQTGCGRYFSKLRLHRADAESMAMPTATKILFLVGLFGFAEQTNEKNSPVLRSARHAAPQEKICPTKH